jgi:NDP-sugar pyrophosphorylase family protein
MSVPRQALVLTAGLGTRLRPLTFVRAKPAIPVGRDPIIRRIIRWLARHAVDDLVLNLHHLPETLTACVGDGSDLGVRVRYSWEQPVVLGSAGGPRHALGLLGSEAFVIVNGDTLTDVDLAALAADHRASGALVTLALVPNHDPMHYGGVQLDADHRVIGFVRRGSGASGSFHFVGVQVARAEVFEPLPDGEPSASIGGVYDALLSDSRGIRGFVSNASFHDVGSVPDYWKTSWELLAAEGGEGRYGRNVAVADSAAVNQCLLWDNIEIPDDCTLDHCIVADGVRLRPGTRYSGVVLVPAASRTAGPHRPDESIDGDLLISPLALQA